MASDSFRRPPPPLSTPKTHQSAQFPRVMDKLQTPQWRPLQIGRKDEDDFSGCRRKKCFRAARGNQVDIDERRSMKAETSSTSTPIVCCHSSPLFSRASLKLFYPVAPIKCQEIRRRPAGEGVQGRKKGEEQNRERGEVFKEITLGALCNQLVEMP